jgi:hypothetical protein
VFGTGSTSTYSSYGHEVRANAFRVTTRGSTYTRLAYNNYGADYAEFFEWADGNPNDEDRTGLFVAMDGTDKIKIANCGDEIIGIVSASPAVVGDNADDWQGKFLTDIYGRLQYELVEVKDPETGKTHIEEHPVLNPDYNPELEYVSREDRQEWSTIGLVGKLVVKDDGTCV